MAAEEEKVLSGSVDSNDVVVISSLVKVSRPKQCTNVTTLMCHNHDFVTE